MKFSELIREIEAAGCYVKRHGSNHEWYYNPITGACFPIGRHLSQEVPKGTLDNIKKKAGLK